MDGRQRLSSHRSGRRQLPWEQATKNAVEKVSETVRDLRIAEVVRQDVTIDGGKVSEFRIRLAFKYDKE
jgi:flavin-binding protein dodecin